MKPSNKAWRQGLLKKNTVLGIIKLPDELFQPFAAATTSILILEKGVPHAKGKSSFVARLDNDGFRLKKGYRAKQSDGDMTQFIELYRSKTELEGWASFTDLVTSNPESDLSAGQNIKPFPAKDGELIEGAERLVMAQLALHGLYPREIGKVKALQAEGALSTSTRNKSTKGLDRMARTKLVQRDRLIDWFVICYGQKSLHSKDGLVGGNNMVISSSGEQNGLYGFFDFDDLIEPPFITVPQTGSIGLAFVQELPCGVTDDCLLLIPREETSRPMLYLAAAAIRAQRWRFNYGRKLTPSRIAEIPFSPSPSAINSIASRLNKAFAVQSSIGNVFE